MSPPRPTLPLIDISPFLTPTSSPSLRAACAKSLASACTTHGFFYLTHHNIPPAITTRILDIARRFFVDSAPDEKRRILRQDPGVGTGDGARGYQIIGENITGGRRDWHEAVDWYRPVVAGEPFPSTEEGEKDGKNEKADEKAGEAEGRDRAPPYQILHGLNQWPSQPEDFRPVYEDYVARMLHLGTAVVRALGVALFGDDANTDTDTDVFVNATRSSWWVMRAIGYPPLRARPSRSSSSSEELGSDEGDEGVSCGAHTDYGCLTLLLADGTKGALQVQDRAGGGWIAADPVEGALVVNLGDMMERWTNGLWASTRHRVVHRGDGFRVSVPFFFEPDWDAWVEPLEECVRLSGGVKRFEGVVYGEHLLGKVRGNFYAGEAEGGG